jgi:hypothetical protein
MDRDIASEMCEDLLRLAKDKSNLQKEIEELKKSIATWGMDEFLSSNIYKKRQLQELIKKLKNEQVFKKQPK